MKKSVAYLAGAAAFALLAGTPAGAVTTLTSADYDRARDGLVAMSGLNLIVLGNMTAGHDVEGKTYVGGNIDGGNFTAGLGASANGQSAVANEFATLTVGGNVSTGFNLNDGPNASNNYGATIGGNTQGFALNGNGARIRIGGSVNVSELTLKSEGNNGAARAADVSISGFVASIVANASGSTIKVGSIGTKIQVGDNAVVEVTAGTPDELKIGANSTLRTGGSVKTLMLGANSSATVTGNVINNLSLSTNDTVKIGGQFQSQNVNGLQSGTTVAVSGANQSQNGAPAGWSFNTGIAYTAPTAPAAPTGPNGIALGTITATLSSNLTTLSNVLDSLYSAPANTAVLNGTTYTFTAGASSTNIERGYAAFNVGSDIFGATNINFDFAASGGVPIVINVSGLDAGTWNWGANPGTGNNSSVNQRVIWNFVDASGSLNFGTIVHGSILAPNATISNRTPIEGSVVAKTFIAGGEVHLGTFNGASAFVMNGAPPPVGAVPEVATWMQMIAGFGVIGFGLRRRRRVVAIAA